MNFLVKTFLLLTLFKLFSCVVVPTQNGPVEGTIRKSDLGRDYFSFMGIPYAKPAEGALKFRDPQPPENWTEPLNCTGEGSEFWNIHWLTGQVRGSFDSLHVNVFSNNITPDSPYPVMVYIHGGAYMSGSGSTEFSGPDFLVEKNVTIVTMNHRLGVYGFLSLNDSNLNVPGNAGLKDQRLALKWVQQNIANFGGDPSQVTLFGLSSGGGSTHFHMLSENSRGLFHRAISMGSIAIQNSKRMFPSARFAHRLAERLGFTGDVASDKNVLEFLENADPSRVLIATNTLVTREEMWNLTAVAFGPTLEPYETEGTVLSANVFDLLENPWSNEIPFLVGLTTMENIGIISSLRTDPEMFKTYTNFETYIPHRLGVERNTEKSRQYAAMIKNTYYPVFEPTITNIDPLAFLIGDNEMWFPTHLTARYRLRAGNKATYVYRFDADTDYRFPEMLSPGVELYRYPYHGIDTAHLLRTVIHRTFLEVSEETRKTVDLMTTSFTNFATSGDPSVPELGIHWPAVSSENELLMGLNIHETDPKIMVLPEAKRMHVFTEIWDTERAGT